MYMSGAGRCKKDKIGYWRVQDLWLYRVQPRGQKDRKEEGEEGEEVEISQLKKKVEAREEIKV